MAERTCVECGETFMHAHGKQTICSKACRNRRARRQHDPAKRRAGKERARPRIERQCKHCDATFTAILASWQDTRGKVYCSDECHREAKRQRYTTRPPQETARRRDARRRLRRAATGSAGRTPWIAGPCASCGELFVFNQPAARVCSPICGRRLSRQAYRARHGRMDNHRHRARVAGVAYEPISARKVYERDGWRCGICGRPVKRKAKVPDSLAPTLDHIVPLNSIDRGPHLYSNVQCAHFECNWRKGRRGQDQLRLIG